MPRLTFAGFTPRMSWPYFITLHPRLVPWSSLKIDGKGAHSMKRAPFSAYLKKLWNSRLSQPSSMTFLLKCRSSPSFSILPDYSFSVVDLPNLSAATFSDTPPPPPPPTIFLIPRQENEGIFPPIFFFRDVHLNADTKYPSLSIQ